MLTWLSPSKARRARLWIQGVLIRKYMVVYNNNSKISMFNYYVSMVPCKLPFSLSGVRPPTMAVPEEETVNAEERIKKL
jgi:hypothetical protein